MKVKKVIVFSVAMHTFLTFLTSSTSRTFPLCIFPDSVYTPASERSIPSLFVPRLKSHSGAKKRFRKTGSGKIAFKRHSRNHLLQQKSKRQKRLNRTHLLNDRDQRNISLLLPNL